MLRSYDLIFRFHCMFFNRFDPMRNHYCIHFHIHVEEEDIEEEPMFVFYP